KINTSHYWLLFLSKFRVEEVCELRTSVTLNGFTRNILKRRRTRSLILFTTELNKFIRSSLKLLLCRTRQKLRRHTLSGGDIRTKHRKFSLSKLRFKLSNTCRSLLNLGLLRFLNLRQLAGGVLIGLSGGQVFLRPRFPLTRLGLPVGFLFGNLSLGLSVFRVIN